MNIINALELPQPKYIEQLVEETLTKLSGYKGLIRNGNSIYLVDKLLFTWRNNGDLINCNVDARFDAFTNIKLIVEKALNEPCYYVFPDGVDRGFRENWIAKIYKEKVVLRTQTFTRKIHCSFTVDNVEYVLLQHCLYKVTNTLIYMGSV